jgi:L-asparaginase/Glu-tRNA(Gln) amidotransferase subunit D
VSRLGVVCTGGTIACDADAGAGTARLGSPDLVAGLVGRVAAAAGIDLVMRQPLHVCSEDMVPADWVSIADAGRELAEGGDVDGILVMHGTDTAAYTTAALAFLLADLDLPVALTGSNRPPGQPGSDAANNVAGAVQALGHLPRGVYLSFAGTVDGASLVHLGTCVRKVRASGPAFVSSGRPLVAVVHEQFAGVDLPELPAAPRRPSRMDPRVIALRCHPGLDFDAMASMLDRAVRGVVIELYPSLTGPTRGLATSLPGFVRRAVARGCPVVATVANPPDDLLGYESGLAIADAGASVLPRLLPETATVKLMWALGQTSDPAEAVALVRQPVAGELDAAAGVCGRGNGR